MKYKSSEQNAPKHPSENSVSALFLLCCHYQVHLSVKTCVKHLPIIPSDDGRCFCDLVFISKYNTYKKNDMLIEIYV